MRACAPDTRHWVLDVSGKFPFSQHVGLEYESQPGIAYACGGAEGEAVGCWRSVYSPTASPGNGTRPRPAPPQLLARPRAHARSRLCKSSGSVGAGIASA